MPSRDINDCCQELRDMWPHLQMAFKVKFPDWDIILTCTHRPEEEQFDLFKKGRTEINGVWQLTDIGARVTNIDGKTRLSMHNYYPAKAFDVALKQPDGKLNWNTPDEQWQELPDIISGLGLVSGGNWEHFRDFPHVEIMGEIKP